MKSRKTTRQWMYLVCDAMKVRICSLQRWRMIRRVLVLMVRCAIERIEGKRCRAGFAGVGPSGVILSLQLDETFVEVAGCMLPALPVPIQRTNRLTGRNSKRREAR